MPQNAGTWDRVVRVALGVALLTLAFVGPQTVWGLLGIVPLLTGLFGYCPVYGVLGIGTASS